MTKNLRTPIILLTVFFVAAALVGIMSVLPHEKPAEESPAAGGPSTAASAEQAVAPEKNPPGDIPDNQAFIAYNSATGGYGLQVPEGWARTIDGTGVRFVDKFDGVEVSLNQTATAPTAGQVRQNPLAFVGGSRRAIKVTGLGGQPGPAAVVVVSFESNSDPDPVTGKQIRLENQCYLFYKDGRYAALTLWAPLGSDNVDQWRLISDSFRWR